MPGPPDDSAILVLTRKGKNGLHEAGTQLSPTRSGRGKAKSPICVEIGLSG